MFRKKKGSSEDVDKSLHTKPQTAQSTLPYKRIYTNGIIEIEEDVFVKAYQVTDTEFSTLSDQGQEEMFLAFEDLLNSFDAETQLQIVFHNKTLDRETFEAKLLYRENGDGMDGYRQEYNDVLRHQMSEGQNGLESKKYYIIRTHASGIDDAVLTFSKIGTEFKRNVKKIADEEPHELTTEEWMGVLYDICHADTPEKNLRTSDVIDGKQTRLFDFASIMKRGLTTKDVICPNGFDFSKGDRFRMGDCYGRALYIAGLPSILSTNFIDSLISQPFNMLVSVFLEPQRQDKVLKMIKNHANNIRDNIGTAQKRNAKDGVGMDLISPDLLEAREDAEELRKLLTQDNQKMFLVTISMCLFSNSKEELEAQTSAILSTCNRYLCEVRVLNFQQEHGFCSSLPLAQCKIFADQMLTTEAASLFQPYTSYDHKDAGGSYYGINQVNDSMIILNRMSLSNYNGAILGQSGSGKSFATKREITSAALSSTDDIIIIDPEREYELIGRALGAEIAKIKPGGENKINPFDMDVEYAGEGENPLPLKVDYISSIYETMANNRRSINAQESSILTRCVTELYEEYITYLTENGLRNAPEKAPTLQDLYEKLDTQPEAEAQNMALVIERYAIGTFDCFQGKTNIDTEKRILIYDMRDIGAGMKDLGLQIALSDAWNRIISNSQQGKRTRLYVDEVHLTLRTPKAAVLLQNIYKRARKYGGIITVITQECEDLLNSQEGRSIINNSDFLMLFSQKAIPREQLARLLLLSKEQVKYITNAEPGSGLICAGKSKIPFRDKFPEDTELYRLMSTDPKEQKKPA